jgi:hypothetical protein
MRVLSPGVQEGDQPEHLTVELAVELAWGQVRVSEMLKRRGLSISPAEVRCVWQRHDLTSMKHRLKALEAKVAQDGMPLTEAQIADLEKAKADKGVTSSRANVNPILPKRRPGRNPLGL